MKLAIVKQGTTGLFRYASVLFSKCDLYTTERRHAGMYSGVCLLPGGHWALLYIPCLFSHQFSVCVHAYAGADSGVHTCIDQRRMLGRQDLSLDRKPQHFG